MKRRTFLRSSAVLAAAAALPRPSRLEAYYRPVTRPRADIRAVTGGGRELTLTTEAVADLASRLKGRVLLAMELARDRLSKRHFDQATCQAQLYTPEAAVDAGL